MASPLVYLSLSMLSGSPALGSVMVSLHSPSRTNGCLCSVGLTSCKVYGWCGLFLLFLHSSRQQLKLTACLPCAFPFKLITLFLYFHLSILINSFTKDTKNLNSAHIRMSTRAESQRMWEQWANERGIEEGKRKKNTTLLSFCTTDAVGYSPSVLRLMSKCVRLP